MKPTIDLTVPVDAQLWQRFLRAVQQHKGLRKGAIQESVEEALTQWIEMEWEEGNGRQEETLQEETNGSTDS